MLITRGYVDYATPRYRIVYSVFTTADAEWLNELVRHDEHARAGNSSRLRTAVRRGILHRITHGIFIPAKLWATLDGDTRFRAAVHATGMRYPQEIFSHQSAAALWRLPAVDPWPQRGESIVAPATGGRSRAHLARHQGPAPDPKSIDGVLVTSLARTVVDLAGTVALSSAVAFADRALSRPDRGATGVHAARVDVPALMIEFERLAPDRFATRRARVIRFADGRAGSPGESISRVLIHMLGFPEPELQVAFYDEAGLIGYVDFWWPEYGVIGEFDGFGKYLREELRAGRTPAEVVVAEKLREDRLRAQVRTVSRWGWAVARSPRALEVRLRAAGLPQRRGNSQTLAKR